MTSIIVCAILAAVALILAWVSALYIEWRASEQKALPWLGPRTLADLDLWMRYMRRARYGTERGIEQGLRAVRGASKQTLMFLFPNSKGAFKENHPLTGLESGPSSYFLLEISADAKANAKGNNSKKRSGRRTLKNM